MAGNVNISLLRKQLADGTAVTNSPFEILKQLAVAVGAGLTAGVDAEEHRVAQDLVLRALEWRGAFGNSSIVLDGLVRQLGLFPYLDPQKLPLQDLIAYEAHRPDNLDERIVFHRSQAKIFRMLMSGQSVVLSAPTSFGKSLIVDGVVATGTFKNIIIIVPTLALIDETRKRLARLGGGYKIITHASQARHNRNICIFTQERASEPGAIDNVDFFVIDEFYKLSPLGDADDRAQTLNAVLYQLLKRCKHFYMLGPGILGLVPDLQRNLECAFVHDIYATVASEFHRIRPKKGRVERLVELCRSLEGPTIIYCKSPGSAQSVVESLAKAGGWLKPTAKLSDAVSWIGKHYHPEWMFVRGLREGIGLHHGRIPRALGQWVVSAFNGGRVDFLVCTSTLIEGVNTKARNIVIYDKFISKVEIDRFTFNNICGRAGRMSQYFVGHVYLFDDPPEDTLPLVDAPGVSQSERASDALLLQLDPADLEPTALARVMKWETQADLDIAVIRENVGLDPASQVAAAKELAGLGGAGVTTYGWSHNPTWNQLVEVCGLFWRHFNGSRLASGSVKSPRQLAFFIRQLEKRSSVRHIVDEQVKGGKTTVDDAISGWLDFVKLWASFHLPRLLRATSRIQQSVLGRAGFPAGNYDGYASRIESLFTDPSIAMLEEYGVPMPLATKLEPFLKSNGDVDLALNKLRGIEPRKIGLDPFEIALIEEAKSGLG